MTEGRAPTLVLAWGNPSRGDDALGPLLAERLAALVPEHPEWGAVEVLGDFQLQVEHALDLDGRARVLFIDAAAGGPEPCSLAPVAPAPDRGPLSHALAPGAVLAVYREFFDAEPPPCALLAVRGYGFELGAPLTEGARGNLEAAAARLQAWLGSGTGSIPAPPGR